MRRRGGASPAGPARRAARSRTGRWIVLVLLAAVVATGAVLADAAWSAARLLGERPAATILLARDGQVLARRGPSWGEPLRYADLPDDLVAAVVAVEDRRFFAHPGLDPVGIARAAARNLAAGRVVEGGSTITQQLAKLAFVGRERSLARKAREAVLAIWLELRLGKEQILEAYLNRVYLGAGAYGVDAASRTYLGRPARALDLAGAALLAGLIRAPSQLNPFRAPEAARARAALVLAAMVETGRITRARADEALARPLVLRVDGATDALGPAADWTVAEARAHAAGTGPDLVVRTSLDAALQRRAVATVERMLRADPRGAMLQAAAVVLDPSGDVLAMVGGRADGGSFNRATMAVRQPGSAFKLFVFLAALEAGVRPDARISTEPLVVDGWTARDGSPPDGPEVTLEEAFARSINASTVRLAERVGRDRVIAMARRLGIARDLPATPSLALGSAGTTLLELTAAYATVADGGVLVRPRVVTAVEDATGRVTPLRRTPRTAVLDAAVAVQARQLLRAVVRNGTGRAALLPDSGGKTGTSSGGRDGWFIGYAGPLTIGVWVGRDDARPVPGLSGGGLPARLFRAIAEEARGLPARLSRRPDHGRDSG